MKQITVFTPTYNRAYTLPVLYDSLKKQTNQNFEWLIIDDGSSDNTSEIVNQWIEENIISIRYIYQKNKGMVAAHDTAHHNITTELTVCIDSDDFMPENGIQIILEQWNENKSPTLMGMVGLDSYKDGKIIGTKFPTEVKQATFSEIIFKHKVKGDKKFVLRTEYVKEHLPYPYIENEKYPAPSYLYLKMENKYKFLLVNEVLCIVEYLPDGNSMNKVKQYMQSPNAFALYRITRMEHAYNYKDKFKNAVHYVSSKFLGIKKNILKDSPAKFTTLLAFPFGFLLSLYIKNTNKSNVNQKLNKK